MNGELNRQTLPNEALTERSTRLRLRPRPDGSRDENPNQDRNEDTDKNWDIAKNDQGSSVDGERGSVLPLLPVLIVVCFLLGTLSVSTASTFLAKRELYNAATAAANDAVSGINDVDYYTLSRYTFDPDKMKNFARRSIAARLGDTIRMKQEDITITLEGDGVRVTLEADFSPVFRGFLPGGLKRTRLKATALAEARTTP